MIDGDSLPAKGFGRGQVKFNLECSQQGAGDRVNLVRPLGDRGPGHRIHGVSEHGDGQLLAQVVGHLATGGQDFLGCQAQLIACRLTDNKYSVALCHEDLHFAI